MNTTDYNLGHFHHIDLESSLKLRLSTRFGVTLSSSNTLSLSQSQSTSNLTVFSGSQSWFSKGQQISLSICLHIHDTLIGDEDVEEFCNVIAKILAQAELWSQLGFECRIDSVARSSPFQRTTFDIRLRLNSHHGLPGNTDHAHRAKSIPDAPVPHGVPTVRLNGITVNLGLSAWSPRSHTVASNGPLRELSLSSPTSDHYGAHGKSQSGLAVVVNLLDASLRRLLFGHSVSRVLSVVEAKQAETSSPFQLAPSIFCPDFREGIALRASTASNIACSLSRMSQRARSEDLTEARIRTLQAVDRLRHLRPMEEDQDHPASVRGIIEIRLWYLMQDCLLNPRAHEGIQPLQLPDNLQELCPLKEQMLEDEELETTNWPYSIESQRVENGCVLSEETMEEIMDDAVDDDLVHSFNCLDDERSSETMLDDEVAESKTRSPEGSFEDLMAMPVESWRPNSIFNDIALNSCGHPCETPLLEEGVDSHTLTSKADSEEEFDNAVSMPDSDEMLDSNFSTVDIVASAFSDAFENEEQFCPGRVKLEDEEDVLDP